MNKKATRQGGFFNDLHGALPADFPERVWQIGQNARRGLSEYPAGLACGMFSGPLTAWPFPWEPVRRYAVFEYLFP